MTTRIADLRGTRGLLFVGALCLLGAAAAHAAVVGWAQGRAEGAPPGWTLVAAPTRYIDEARLGTLGLASDAWALSQYRTLTGAAPARRLALEGVFPEKGTLELRPAGDIVVLRLERGAPPTVLEVRGTAATALPCTGALPSVGPEAYPLVVTQTDVGFTAESASDTLTCATTSLAPQTPPKLIPGLQRVHLRSLAAGGVEASPPLSRATHAAALVGGGLLLALLGTMEARAGIAPVAVVWTALPLALCAMLAGTNLSGVRELARIPELPTRHLTLLAGVFPALALKGLVLAASVARRADSRPLLWIAIVLAVVSWLLVSFGGTPAQFLAGLPLLGAPGLAWMMARFRTLTRAGSGVGPPPPIAAAAAVGLCAAFFAGFGALSGMGAGGGRVYLAEAGALVGALVWLGVHASRVRGYNAASLILAVCLLGTLEMATRFTSAGRFWTADLEGHGAGSRQAMIDTLESLEQASAADYPSSGFPVRAPPKAAGTRIVCLGASSTGGAWQDDDLGHFYPAQLQARLGPDTEVVNQGVGGWTSFHVARFSSGHLASLKPDIVTVYLGVNEGTPAPMSFAELHAAWRAGRLEAGPSWVYSLRLFNGLRFLVQGLRGRYFDAAVPPSDFEENLESLAADAERAGARLLLLSEALQPDSRVLSPYWDRMEAVAERHAHVAFLDTAAQTQGLGPGLFLDANHLTVAGHTRVAARLAEELARLGWVDPIGP